MNRGRRRNYRPTPAQAAEDKNKRKIRNNFFELRTNEMIDHKWLNSLDGKITFLTGTMGFVEPNAYCRKYRFSTRRKIPFDKICSIIKPMLPPNTRMTKAGFYKYTHSVDVVFSEGIRVDTFIWRVSRALEDEI